MRREMTYSMFRSIILGRALQQLLKETVELIGSAKTVRKGNIKETFTLMNMVVFPRALSEGPVVGFPRLARFDFWLSPPNKSHKIKLWQVLPPGKG